MPCMIAGASGGIAPAWLATMQRAAGLGEAVEVLPLDAEPVLVDRVVQPPGHLAQVLAAAPRVDVGAAEVGVRPAPGSAARERDEVAGAVEHRGLGHQIEIRARRVGDVGALGEIGHP